MGGGGDIPLAAHHLGHDGDCVNRAETKQEDGAGDLRAGQHLEGHTGKHRERSEGPGQEFRHVIAGDVLHHPSPRSKHLTPAADRAYAEDMVPGGTGERPPGAGQVAGDYAADGGLPRGVAVKGTKIGGLKSEPLVVLRQQRLDVDKRRSRRRLQYQFARFVIVDAREPRQRQASIGHHRAAKTILGIVADDLETAPVGERLGDGGD